MKRFPKAAVRAAALALLSTAGWSVPAATAYAAPVEATVPAVPAIPAEEGVPPTDPPNAISEKEAVAKVRALFDGLSELPYVVAHYVSPDARHGGFPGVSSHPMWILTFSAKDPAHPPTSTFELPDMLSAEVDAVTGEVLSFSRQNPAWTGDRQPSRELATQVAAAFLQKIDPRWTDRWVERVGGGITQSSSANGKTLQWRFSEVTFSEKVHGIPFPQNRIDIYVDGFGHVVGMQVLRPFDSAKLPDPSGAIPLDKARDLLAGSIQLEKVYLTAPIKVDPSGHIHKESRPVLAYVPTRQPSIDALTGQPVQMGIPLSDIEVNKIVSITGQGQTLRAKDREAAKRLVENFLHLDPSNMTLVDSKETESPDPLGDSRRWELTWSSHSPAHPPASQDPADSASAQPTWIHAEFDADTGQWLNLSTSTETLRGKPPVLSVQEGEEKALSFLQEVLPKGKQHVQLVWELDLSNLPLAHVPDWFDPAKDPNALPEPQPLYTYMFRPMYQGVPVADLTYSVTVDGTSGRIVGFTLPPGPPTPEMLPDNRNTITAEQAKAIYRKEQPIRLVYIWPQFGSQAAPQGQLVYEIDQNSRIQYIDAFTGAPVFLMSR